MKTVLPWVAAIAALCAAYFFFSADQKKSSDLASLRAVIGEGDQVREENDGLKKIKARADEISRLKKDNEDVAKLRSEVQQLREDKQGLANQIQTAQETIDAAKSKIVAIAASKPTQPKPVIEPASREEMNSMKMAGVALMMSANDNDGVFPTNFTGTTAYFENTPSFDSKVLEQFELFSPTHKVNEIKEPSTTVLARGKFTDASGRRTYLFADGHVEIRKDDK